MNSRSGSCETAAYELADLLAEQVDIDRRDGRALLHRRSRWLLGDEP